MVGLCLPIRAELIEMLRRCTKLVWCEIQGLPWRTHSCVPHRHSCRCMEPVSRRVSTRHARVRALRHMPPGLSYIAIVLTAATLAAQPYTAWRDYGGAADSMQYS